MLNNIGEARRSYENSTPSGKFTQEDAARYFGVSVGTYAHWEQGKGKLNGEVLCAIADKYGCSTDYLLCRTSDPTPYRPVVSGPSLSEDEEYIVGTYRSVTVHGKKAMLSNTKAVRADYMPKSDEAGVSEVRSA